MYKCISKKWCSTREATVEKFLMDSEALAVVAEGGKAFIVNASDVASLPKCCPGSGAWVEHGTVALSLAEEGSF